MDTRGEKVHKRMVICGSCGRLEEEKEEKRPLVGVSSPTSKTSLERKGVVESLRGAEVLSERLQFDVKKGAWRGSPSVPWGEGPNSGPRDQDYRGVFRPRRNQPDASDESLCASSTSPNRDMSLPWNHGSFTCSPKIEGKRNQDMTRINANEGARANSHCPGAMLAAIVRCSRLSGEYLRSYGVWGVMTVDPNTSRRPIMLQVENHLIVPIVLRIEQSQQYAKNWPFEGKLPIRAFMVQVDLGLNRTRARNYCRTIAKGYHGQEVPQVCDTFHHFALVLSPLSDNPNGISYRLETSFDSSWVRAGYRHRIVDHAMNIHIPSSRSFIVLSREEVAHTIICNLSSAGRILLKFGFLPLQRPPYPRVSRICGHSVEDVIALILRYGIYRGVI
ncbi:hypothetical protein BO85DRAFT_455042 [Aspergillus piperis CBS 112811]|uniref:Uncharacterized protein n=1 Tax=Aspergillus piperis CBS 112811 TaxID=1448313 RepID=A0A8G1RBV5_9EURO|nr:hypothetical protein BO85DRAFT_455042 [Aspergillus piperis CBS 112811]RAH62988.1 hypothetical protein BO85DRAFT_455042 [Aspergillus piperis CBS 112811]